MNDDAEMVFDHTGIGATTGVQVSMLAYIATSDGVGAIVPSGARISTTQVIMRPIPFTDKVFWPSLANGYPSVASDVPTQWIAPMVEVNPGFKTQPCRMKWRRSRSRSEIPMYCRTTANR